MKVDNQKLKEIYVVMKRCRAFEERAIVELRKGMPGFIHTSIGQEAISAGVCAFLQDDDYLLTTHRGHSDIIAKGASFDKMMAELYARETGYCKGMGGSMHIAALDKGIVGALAIVGSGIPVASGVALGCKMQNLSRVTVCSFGDGASCTGSFHEGVGFAAAFNLPVVFLLQNNQYEESTHWSYWRGKLEHLSERAAAYGIPGVSVDGNDAEAVADAASDAIDKTRQGGGPILLECLTYRVYGHHMGDPGTGYRSKEEVDEWRGPAKDPISRLYARLIERGVLTEEENQLLDAKLSQELDAAVEFALASPEISPQDAFRDTVYSGRQIGLSKI